MDLTGWLKPCYEARSAWEANMALCSTRRIPQLRNLIPTKHTLAKRKPVRGWRTYRSVAGKVVKEVEIANDDMPAVTIFFRDGTQLHIRSTSLNRVSGAITKADRRRFDRATHISALQRSEALTIPCHPSLFCLQKLTTSANLLLVSSFAAIASPCSSSYPALAGIAALVPVG
jgi:hypothetical protein